MQQPWAEFELGFLIPFSTPVTIMSPVQPLIVMNNKNNTLFISIAYKKPTSIYILYDCIMKLGYIQELVVYGIWINISQQDTSI